MGGWVGGEGTLVLCEGVEAAGCGAVREERRGIHGVWAGSIPHCRQHLPPHLSSPKNSRSPTISEAKRAIHMAATAKP